MDTDPIHKPVQLGENRQSAWEEFEAFHWGRDGTDMEAVLDVGHA